MSNYPPGYNGQDEPDRTVVLRCPKSHYWQATETHELGAVTFDEDCCPYCGEFGEVTDHEEVPLEDEWDADLDDDEVDDDE